MVTLCTRLQKDTNKRSLKLLKDKQVYYKILGVYLSNNRLVSGSAKPEGVRSTPPTGARERLLWRKGRSKVKKLLIGYGLKPSWQFVIGCP